MPINAPLKISGLSDTLIKFDSIMFKLFNANKCTEENIRLKYYLISFD